MGVVHSTAYMAYCGSYSRVDTSHELGSHVPNPYWVPIVHSSILIFQPFFVGNHSLVKDLSLRLLAHISRASLVRVWYLIELQSNFSLQVSLFNF